MRLEETTGHRHHPTVVRVRRARPADQALSLGAAALHGIVRECVGPHWRPLAICFAHRAPADLRPTTASSEPACSSSTTSPAWCSTPATSSAANPLSDPLMRPYAQRFLESVVSPRATTSASGSRSSWSSCCRSGSAPWTTSPARSGSTGGRCTDTSRTRASRSARSCTRPAPAGRALPRQRPVLDDRRLPAARVHRPERLLPVVPPAVRHESQRLALHQPRLTPPGCPPDCYRSSFTSCEYRG